MQGMKKKEWTCTDVAAGQKKSPAYTAGDFVNLDNCILTNLN